MSAGVPPADDTAPRERTVADASTAIRNGLIYEHRRFTDDDLWMVLGEVERLDAENAKLNAILDDAGDSYKTVRDQIDRVRALLDIHPDEWNSVRAVLRDVGEALDGTAVKRGPIDDQVARWIKQRRDVYDHIDGAWHVLDDLLDDYRLHRVTGTPLDQHACNGSYCCRDEDEAEFDAAMAEAEPAQIVEMPAPAPTPDV